MSKQKNLTLGTVLFEGFELLDVYGPLEMFGNVGEQLKIVMVAEKAGLVTSAQGPRSVADYGFGDCPHLDLIHIPGGFGAIPQAQNPAMLKFLCDRSHAAQLTLSVCNGSGLIAAAGILDGRQATTNKQFFHLVAAQGKRVNWIEKARWVDDGDIISSSGVSAGMDMALAVIQRLFGKDTAEAIAAATEYEWHRDPFWDPFVKYLDQGKLPK
ncbi:MAG: DJ-1/PfpI family protein [Deltaproteobacteria bacterium]|nr:DJ-1/PfpI family protein [Deltaproteobacteria bacterium]